MALYEGKEKPRFGFKFSISKKMLVVCLAIVLLLLVAILLSMFGSNPISAYFEKPKIKANETTHLYVKFTNLSRQNYKNVEVIAIARQRDAIAIDAIASNKVSKLSPGENRTFTFFVNPLDECQNCYVHPGNYLIDIVVSIDGKTFKTAQINLTIE